MNRVAVVVPRYGVDLGGGAENQARGFAEEMVRRGWQVEVWTSCARDHFTWENGYPAGTQEINGVAVHRFPITNRNPERQAAVESQLVAAGALPPGEQYAWLEAAAHSAPLYTHVARQAHRFDAVIALPYANPLVHYAAWAAPERTIVWPCLHDEPYAYLEPTRLLLESVRGVMFNSPEEGALAVQKLHVRPQQAAVLGEGVLPLPPVPAVVGNGKLLPAPSSTPYLAYVGRLEEGKNLRLLYDYVLRLAGEGQNIRLVVMGRGPLEPPKHPAFDYRGFAGDEEKATVCAGALALCQPSLNESFSLTIMESWLAGRPVLVHETCAVTREHVRRSKGGLWFYTFEEFAAAVTWLHSKPALAAQMGANGRHYVQSNYTWPAVVDRFARILAAWQGGEPGES
ncbi:MAG: glycosyltransferase family 4 protein [Chloroflexi bacterium]|nr:glycosyltransferase family 4 protein [Chloroflexota bacterium]MCI0647393.1 glycosyltransferase family 4 protein [Chloroflexota bacterium]